MHMRRPSKRRGGIGSISSSSLTEFDTSNGTGVASASGATFNDATNEYVSPSGTVTNYGGQVANQLTSSIPSGVSASNGGLMSVLSSFFGQKAGAGQGAKGSGSVTLGGVSSWVPLAIAAVIVYALLRKK